MWNDLQAAKRQHQAFHVFSQQLFTAVLARSKAGLATTCQGREHDGPGVHGGQRVVDICFNHKVGTFDADGRDRRVETKAVTRSLAPGAGDGAHHAFIQAELDGSQGRLIIRPAVIFDLQTA